MAEVFGAPSDVISESRGQRCPHCEEYAVQHDEDSLHMICLSCGSVVDEACLVTDVRDLFTSAQGASSYKESSLPQDIVIRNIKVDPPGLRHCIKEVKNAANFLSFSSVMTEEAVNLFKHSYYDEHIKKKFLETKQIIAVCCAYAVARMRGWPVTKTEMAKYINKTVSDVTFWYRVVVNINKLEIKSLDIEEIVPSEIKKFNIPKEITPTVIDIIRLCKKTWISGGRNPLNVILAAIFVAYQSHEASSKPITLKKFRDTFKIKANLPYSVIHEIQGVLLRLGEEIPWETVTKENLHLLTKDILQSQSALLFNISKQQTKDQESTEKNHEKDDTELTSKQSSEQEQESSHVSETILPSSSSKVKDSVVSRKRSLRGNDNEICPKRLKQESGGVLNPLSFLVNRQKAEKEPASVKLDDQDDLDSNVNLDDTELGANDIPDSQMNEYVKTDVEVMFHMALSKDSE